MTARGSPAHREAAESTIHLAVLRHIDRHDFMAQVAQQRACPGESVGHQHRIVDPDAVGGVFLSLWDFDHFPPVEGPVARDPVPSKEPTPAQPGDPSLVMQHAGYSPDVDQAGTETPFAEPFRQPSGTLRIGAVGHADEEVVARLADVAAIESAGWRNPI